MDFNKNKIIEKSIKSYLDTLATLIDTEDFVKKRYTNSIDRLIYKNFKKKVKEINVYYWLYLEDLGVPLSRLKRLIIWFSGLRSVFDMEKREQAKKEQERKARAEMQQSKKKRKKKGAPKAPQAP